MGNNITKLTIIDYAEVKDLYIKLAYMALKKYSMRFKIFNVALKRKKTIQGAF